LPAEKIAAGSEGVMEKVWGEFRRARASKISQRYNLINELLFTNLNYYFSFNFCIFIQIPIFKYKRQSKRR